MVTAARLRRALQVIVRTPSSILGVIRVGVHQRVQSRELFILQWLQHLLAAEGESGREVFLRPHTGAYMGLVPEARDTGSDLQEPPSLRSWTGTPKGQLVDTAQAWVYRRVKGVCLSLVPPQPCLGSTCQQMVTMCTWYWTSLRSSTLASLCTGTRLRTLQNPGGTETW